MKLTFLESFSNCLMIKSWDFIHKIVYLPLICIFRPLKKVNDLIGRVFFKYSSNRPQGCPWTLFVYRFLLVAVFLLVCSCDYFILLRLAVLQTKLPLANSWYSRINNDNVGRQRGVVSGRRNYQVFSVFHFVATNAVVIKVISRRHRLSVT